MIRYGTFLKNSFYAMGYFWKVLFTLWGLYTNLPKILFTLWASYKVLFTLWVQLMPWIGHLPQKFLFAMKNIGKKYYYVQNSSFSIRTWTNVQNLLKMKHFDQDFNQFFHTFGTKMGMGCTSKSSLFKPNFIMKL